MTKNKNNDFKNLKKEMMNTFDKHIERMINQKLNELGTKQNYIDFSYINDKIGISSTKLSDDEKMILSVLFVIAIETKCGVKHDIFEEFYKHINNNIEKELV